MGGGGGANANFQGDKKFVDGGGVIVVHRGPKSIICLGPPYFTERAWAARISDGWGGGALVLSAGKFARKKDCKALISSHLVFTWRYQDKW